MPCPTDTVYGGAVVPPPPPGIPLPPPPGSSSRFRGRGIEIIGTGTQQQRMHRRQAAIARRGSVCAFTHVFIRLQIGRLSYTPESEDTQRCVVRQRRRSTRGDLHADARCREMHCKTFTLPQQKTAFRTRTKQQDCRQVFLSSLNSS